MLKSLKPGFFLFPDAGTQLLTKGMGRVFRWYRAQRNTQRTEGKVFKEESISSYFFNRRNQTH